MIRVQFFKNGGFIQGFEITGHSGSAQKGEDVICAAVSSAAFMAVNTISEVLRLNSTKVTIKEGYIRAVYSDCDAGTAKYILEGLKLHLHELSEQYPQNIQISEGGKANV